MRDASAEVLIALVRCADAARFALAADSPLTAWERTTASAIAHDRRRGEWVAGRVAAKWLVHHAQSSSNDPPAHWPPRIRRVEASELESISTASYRRVEISRTNDGMPRIIRDAVTAGDHLSIAHCRGWAVAAYNGQGEIGVDLEEIAPRDAAFYDSTMSDRERRWMADAPKAEADRLGTLLWVLKEACLKTGVSPTRSIWDFRAIDLEIAIPSPVVAASVSSSGESHLLSLPVRAPLERDPDSVRVAYGTVGGLVFGVVAVVPLLHQK